MKSNQATKLTKYRFLFEAWNRPNVYIYATDILSAMSQFLIGLYERLDAEMVFRKVSKSYADNWEEIRADFSFFCPNDRVTFPGTMIVNTWIESEEVLVKVVKY